MTSRFRAIYYGWQKKPRGHCLRYGLRRASTMPVSCCAVGCANRFSKESDITFYRFLEEQGRRQLWVNAVSRAKWE